MIDRKSLLEAARYADARHEELGLEGWATQENIDYEALIYVGRQRGLRVALLLSGHDPRVLSQTEPTDVSDLLTPEAEELMSYFAAATMDGIAIGIKARNLSDYGQGKRTR
jgi:hypothetical protein